MEDCGIFFFPKPKMQQQKSQKKMQLVALLKCKAANISMHDEIAYYLGNISLTDILSLKVTLEKALPFNTRANTLLMNM